MQTKRIARANQEAPFITPEGAQRRVLSYAGSLMLVEFRFAAGASAARHSHPHEQVGYVVAGEIDFIAEGEETVRLTAGGSYYVAPHVQHYIVTYAPTVLLDCFTPLREDFFSP